MNQASTIIKERGNKSGSGNRRNIISSRKNGSPSKSTVKKSTISGKSKQDNAIQYVLPLGNGWVVKGGNTAVFTAITDSKAEAINMARTIAQSNHLELIVHGKDGSIEISENYSIT